MRRRGEIIEWIGTVLDIHEIVEARANLEQTTNLLRLAQDAAGAGVWEWDIKAGLVRQSIDSARMHGLVVEEPVARDTRIESPAQRFEALIHPDDLPQVCAEARRAINQQATFSAEYRVMKSGYEGEAFWVQSFGRVVFAPEGGDCLSIVGLKLDVTERKQAEAALRLSEESLTLALDGGTDGLWDWNVVSGALNISGRFFPALGYEIGEIDADIGCWSKLVHPDDAENALHMMREYLRGHSSVYECEYRLRTKAGAYR